MSSFLSVGLPERVGMLVAQKVLNARGLLAYARDHQLKKVGVLRDSTQAAKVKAADNIVFSRIPDRRGPAADAAGVRRGLLEGIRQVAEALFGGRLGCGDGVGRGAR